VGRAGGTGKIVYLFNFYIIGKSNIMPDQFKVRIPQKMFNITLLSCKKIVKANDIHALFYKPFTEMASQKTRSAGY
jgi:hypothetical protein